MPHLSKGTKVTDTSRTVFVALQIYPTTRDVLAEVAKEKRMTICALVEELANDAKAKIGKKGRKSK